MTEKIWDYTNDAKLEGLVENLKSTELRLIHTDKHTGSWMTIWGTTMTGVVLSDT